MSSKDAIIYNFWCNYIQIPRNKLSFSLPTNIKKPEQVEIIKQQPVFIEIYSENILTPWWLKNKFI